jgi:uncharacterized Tic20 family protein
MTINNFSLFVILFTIALLVFSLVLICDAVIDAFEEKED